MTKMLKNSPREKLFNIIKKQLDELTIEAQNGDEKSTQRLEVFRKSIELHFINTKTKHQTACLDCKHGGFFVDMKLDGSFYIQLGVCKQWTVATSREEGGLPPTYCTLLEYPPPQLDEESPIVGEKHQDIENSEALDMLNNLIGAAKQ
jgi:hypothetical protein